MPQQSNGPASYFPSIEKKYGRPIAYWKDLIAASPLTRHGELVTWLKDEHGLGHGHANALVAHTLAENEPRLTGTDAGAPGARPDTSDRAPGVRDSVTDPG